MQAVILAGGKGTRLHPLTSKIPKPMVKVFDKPVLEHTIELLRHHGIRDMVITVSYKAEHIMDYFGNGSKWGVNIQYFLEDVPLGTAGGLRHIQPLIKDTFVVISGDAVTDFDLTSALEFHRKRSSIATLLTYNVDDPSQFGIVHSSDDGKIIRFQEKPKRSEAFTDTVNTGIYILEPEVISYVPYGSAFDFSKGMFPMLLQNDEPFYSYRTEGYWCDVGNLAQYRNVHFDALMGKVKLNMSATRVADGIWIGDGAEIHPTVKMIGPLYIGKGAKVRRKSTLGRFAVLGNTSLIEEGAQVTHSVIDTASCIGKNSEVYGSIVGSGFKLSDGRNLADEVVVHDGPDNVLRAEIVSELLSPTVSSGTPLTWSALEASRFSIPNLARPVAA